MASTRKVTKQRRANKKEKLKKNRAKKVRAKVRKAARSTSTKKA